MVKVNSDTVFIIDPHNYLRNHIVFKIQSTCTKLRVVFTGSRATLDGYSGNVSLSPSLVLQGDISGLILRWRLFRYVFNADIEKIDSKSKYITHIHDSKKLLLTTSLKWICVTMNF